VLTPGKSFYHDEQQFMAGEYLKAVFHGPVQQEALISYLLLEKYRTHLREPEKTINERFIGLINKKMRSVGKYRTY
jgi:hypothetical protein